MFVFVLENKIIWRNLLRSESVRTSNDSAAPSSGSDAVTFSEQAVYYLAMLRFSQRRCKMPLKYFSVENNI